MSTACQPGSTTTVWCGSMMMAGPSPAAGGQVSRRLDVGVVPAAAGKNRVRAGRCPAGRDRRGQRRARRDSAPRRRPPRPNHLDDQRFVRLDEAEALACAASNAASHARRALRRAVTGRARCRCRRSGHARSTMDRVSPRSTPWPPSRPGLAAESRDRRSSAAERRVASGCSIASGAHRAQSARPMP